MERRLIYPRENKNCVLNIGTGLSRRTAPKDRCIMATRKSLELLGTGLLNAEKSAISVKIQNELVNINSVISRQ